VIAAWLGAGCLGWALLPNDIGLLALALCHGCAWSLAWAGPMLAVDRSSPAAALPAAGEQKRRPGDVDRGRRHNAQPSPTPMSLRHGFDLLAQTFAAPVLVLALGWSLANLGATALIGVHLALALWAIAGVRLNCSRDLPARAPAAGAVQLSPTMQPEAPPADQGFATAPTWRADLP
jgi:hypothetical protein